MDINQALHEIDAIVKEYFDLQHEEFIPGKTKIPLMVPPITHVEIREIMDSLLRTEYTMGRKVRKFEELFAEYMGVKYAVMVNSGSSANLLVLSVLTNPMFSNPIKPGDEIIVPAVGWATTYYPIVNVGAVPVFVDIELGTYDINVDLAEEAITKSTRAIMPVHLAGNPCDMNRLCEISEEHNLYLIEDCCEAHGAEFDGKKVGSFGDMGTFSFYISHHMTTIEGGIIVTSDEEMWELLKSLRAFGWIRDLSNKEEITAKYAHLNERFIFINLGYNLRPTELNAAIGIQQIHKLDSFIRGRRENADYWLSALKEFEDVLILPSTTKGGKHVWYGFPLTVRPEAPFTRNELTEYLEKNLIETRPLMSGNMLDHPSAKLYRHRVHKDLPNAQLTTTNSFFFGNHPGIGREARKYIYKCIARFISARTKR